VDKCQRFDEITAKFGGKKSSSDKFQASSSSSRNMPIAVELYSSNNADGITGDIRRFSTGRLSSKNDSNVRRPDLRREHSASDAPALNRESNNISPKLSDSKISASTVSEKVNRNRRASSFDPNSKDGRDKTPTAAGGEDDYLSRTPFSGGESSPATNESSVSSTTTKETRDSLDQVDKEVVFTSTEVLALRLMFSMYDRSGSATIEYEDLVAYAQETGNGLIVCLSYHACCNTHVCDL
jgi:hypothetical protein